MKRLQPVRGLLVVMLVSVAFGLLIVMVALRVASTAGGRIEIKDSTDNTQTHTAYAKFATDVYHIQLTQIYPANATMYAQLTQMVLPTRTIIPRLAPSMTAFHATVRAESMTLAADITLTVEGLKRRTVDASKQR